MPILGLFLVLSKEYGVRSKALQPFKEANEGKSYVGFLLPGSWDSGIQGREYYIGEK